MKARIDPLIEQVNSRFVGRDASIPEEPQTEEEIVNDDPEKSS
jgi:hypothetical protein